MLGQIRSRFYQIPFKIIDGRGIGHVLPLINPLKRFMFGERLKSAVAVSHPLE